MAKFQRVSVVVLLALLSVQLVFSSDLPSPSPSPKAGVPDAEPPSPAHSPELSASPPAPPTAGHSPSPSPSAGAPSPSPDADASPSKSPSPAPTEPADGGQKSDITAHEKDSGSSSGLSGGQKAGVALGVIAGVCLVGFGGSCTGNGSRTFRDHSTGTQPGQSFSRFLLKNKSISILVSIVLH